MGYNSLYPQILLTGKIIDKETLKPISAAHIRIQELNKTSLSDSSGDFSFSNITAQKVNILCLAEGYHSVSMSINFDSSSLQKRITIFLISNESITDTIDVSERYFKKGEDIHTSYNTAENEEIRKAPGTVEDVIKYFQTNAGVSIANDANNDLLVRGGSPIEDLTLMDGIEIINPNHYGPPGSTSGALSYINLKLIKDADFYSGGFPVKYGNRISSVLDLKLREGNQKKQKRDLNISFTGFGIFLEGPLTRKSNYMFSLRRSYLELIKKDLSTEYLPNYWDSNLKLVYNFSENEKLSVIGLMALDKANPYDEIKNEVDYTNTPINLKLFTVGINYFKIKKNELFRITISDNYSYYNASLSANISNYLFNLNITDDQLNLVTELKKNVVKNVNIDLTAEFKYYTSAYDVYSAGTISSTGYYLPAVNYNENPKTYRASLSANFNAGFLSNKLTLSAGLRIDYLDCMKNGISISPRAGLSYKLLPLTTLNANAGIYSQPPEFLWLLSRPENINLTFINAKEIILGIEHFLSEDIRFNAEAYYKYYNGYPVSVYDPYFIFINISGVIPNFLDQAESIGNGYYTGLDFTLQKKNRNYGLYGTLNASFSKSSFKAIANTYQPNQFDYGKQFTLIAGYRLRSNWIFSFRMKYSDGRPYTPFDIARSKSTYDHGFFDMSQYGMLRMPYYFRLDARLDKQIEIGKTLLIAYVEVWNILNRKNLYNYEWRPISKTIQENYQWGRVPVLGISYKF